MHAQREARPANRLEPRLRGGRRKVVGVGGVGARAAAVWRGGTETLDVASEIFAVVREPATYSSISSLPDRRYRNVAAASATSSISAC